MPSEDDVCKQKSIRYVDVEKLPADPISAGGLFARPQRRESPLEAQGFPGVVGE